MRRAQDKTWYHDEQHKWYKKHTRTQEREPGLPYRLRFLVLDGQNRMDRLQVPLGK